MTEISPLQKARLQYQPKLPLSLRKGVLSLKYVIGDKTESVADREQISRIFEHTGNIMPPKTTWFEPKLRSGLVIHSLD